MTNCDAVICNPTNTFLARGEIKVQNLMHLWMQTPFESDTEFSSKDGDISVDEQLHSISTESWWRMDWIIFSPSCHFTNHTYLLCMQHIYALLFYTLNGQKLQHQHSLWNPFPTMLFGKYQIVPFSYLYKFFRWNYQKASALNLQHVGEKRELSKLFLFQLLNPDL